MIILTKNHIDAELQQKTQVAGQFRLVVRGPDGEVRRDTGWFDNIILDSGLNRWGTNTVVSGVAIGTGTSTPVATQTGLDAQSAYTSTSAATTEGNSGVSPYYGTYSVTYRFALGALNGNYTEVGVGWASGANMFSRALIVDALGSPTTLSVTSAEQLDVSYTLRAYAPIADVTTTATIGGVSTTITTRASLASNSGWGANLLTYSKNYINNQSDNIAFNGSLGLITGSPSGATSNSSSIVASTYVNNSLSVTHTTTFGLIAGNLSGGISAVRVKYQNSMWYQHGFSPSIAKDGTKTLSLVMSQSWARRP